MDSDFWLYGNPMKGQIKVCIEPLLQIPSFLRKHQSLTKEISSFVWHEVIIQEHQIGFNSQVLQMRIQDQFIYYHAIVGIVCILV